MKQELELKNTNLQQLIVDDKYRLLRHFILLLAVLIVIFYSSWLSEYTGAYKYYRLSCVYGGLITMCYVNMLVLVPVFFFTGRYILYIIFLLLLAFLGLTAMSYLLHAYQLSAPLPGGQYYKKDDRGLYEGFIILIPIILVTTMIKLFQRWTRDNKRLAELNNITLMMELNELKNQISPHFLFNMLNGIKALIRSNPGKATHVIMELSEFLRYQIYENNEEQTLLKSEVAFLSNFLNLEMLRRDKLSIEISLPDTPEILNGIMVPPNLFTTFVENAVKHSVDVSGGEPYIKIEFIVVADQLHFSCTNSKDPLFTPRDQKNSGLGLVNIKRRLELLYQENYSLTVDSIEYQFSILLKLPL
ncbi:histidine kinase [Pedobacter sp. UYP1]|uniref:sensor histidine kinase n=1 Tax=Pedobacter sp. UYP1 TaxID=1756396 RepID=UPI00339376A6